MKTSDRAPGRAKCIPVRDAVLLPFQRRWIEDKSRLKGAEKSRQIGWTWASAYSLVRRKASTEGRLDGWVTSRDDFQAKLYLEDCQRFAQLLQLGADAIGDISETVLEWKDGQGKRQKSTAYMLPFATGLRIFSLSSNEDAQAGKRGDREFDEFALHPRQRRLYGIGYPGITWGGQLSFYSTHRGSASFFNELIREIREKGNPKKISLHRVTLEDALNEGLLYKLQGKLPEDSEIQQMDEGEYFNFIKGGCSDEETFNEEYMCVPSDDASAFLSFELIDGVKYLHDMEWETSYAEMAAGTGEIFIGVDVGRKKDLTVIWVIERLAGLYLTRKVITLAKTPFAEQKAVLAEVFRETKCRRMCLDETGLGMNLAEDLRKMLGGQVEPITFTAGAKEALAYPVKNCMEDKTLRIPDEARYVAAFRKVKKEVTSTGTVRFVAEATEDGHADEFWALALAIHAAQKPSEMHRPRAFPTSARAADRANRRLI